MTKSAKRFVSACLTTHTYHIAVGKYSLVETCEEDGSILWKFHHSRRKKVKNTKGYTGDSYRHLIIDTQDFHGIYDDIGEEDTSICQRLSKRLETVANQVRVLEFRLYYRPEWLWDISLLYTPLEGLETLLVHSVTYETKLLWPFFLAILDYCPKLLQITLFIPHTQLSNMHMAMEVYKQFVVKRERIFSLYIETEAMGGPHLQPVTWAEVLFPAGQLILPKLIDQADITALLAWNIPVIRVECLLTLDYLAQLLQWIEGVVHTLLITTGFDFFHLHFAAVMKLLKKSKIKFAFTEPTVWPAIFSTQLQHTNVCDLELAETRPLPKLYGLTHDDSKALAKVVAEYEAIEWVIADNVKLSKWESALKKLKLAPKITGLTCNLPAFVPLVPHLQQIAIAQTSAEWNITKFSLSWPTTVTQVEIMQQATLQVSPANAAQITTVIAKDEITWSWNAATFSPHTLVFRRHLSERQIYDLQDQQTTADRQREPKNPNYYLPLAVMKHTLQPSVRNVVVDLRSGYRTKQIFNVLSILPACEVLTIVVDWEETWPFDLDTYQPILNSKSVNTIKVQPSTEDERLMRFWQRLVQPRVDEWREWVGQQQVDLGLDHHQLFPSM